jgi:aminoglycoside phosphotransferase (APT) family kinase protein
MSDAPADPVDAILARHGVRGPWAPLPATGIANRIYATRDVVLRVGTDHPEAVCDARTESVAAPVARAAGIRTPRMLAFDDSGELTERPHSLWERVHGETVGLFAPDPLSIPETWREVGRELARLHVRVRECPDPNGWLDEPGREVDLEARLAAHASASRVDAAMVADLSRWIEALHPRITVETETCFLHDDIHPMNLMCARDGALLAVIDWGDAGWGDPVIEFAQIPLAAVPFSLEGYREVAPSLLGADPEARVLWDRLDYAFADLEDGPVAPDALVDLRRFVDRGDPVWRRILG